MAYGGNSYFRIIHVGNNVILTEAASKLPVRAVDVLAIWSMQLLAYFIFSLYFLVK